MVARVCHDSRQLQRGVLGLGLAGVGGVPGMSHYAASVMMAIVLSSRLRPLAQSVPGFRIGSTVPCRSCGCPIR